MVEVSARDLHRLLLAFRAAVESDGGAPWQHAVDWDWSFEQLADAVDADLAAAGAPPDPRTRCQHSSAYVWPQSSGPVWPVVIRGDPASTRRTRHLASVHPEYTTLCGTRFATEDIIKRPRARYEPCAVCERERQLRGAAVDDPR